MISVDSRKQHKPEHLLKFLPAHSQHTGGAGMQISLDLVGEVEQVEAIAFLKSELDARIEAISCPVHHRPPAEKAGELIGLRYVWRFRGVCCQALVAEIKSTFAEAERSAGSRLA